MVGPLLITLITTTYDPITDCDAIRTSRQWSFYVINPTTSRSPCHYLSSRPGCRTTLAAILPSPITVAMAVLSTPLLISFLAVIAVGFAFQSLNDCGSHAEGTVVEEGRYFYTCEKGDLKQSGCLTNSNLRIPVEGTFEQNGYLMKCSLTPSLFLSLEFVACIHKGRTIYPGVTYETDSAWYSCDKQDFFIVQHIMGCVYKGTRLSKNERIRDGDVLYQCVDKSSMVDLHPIGCVLDDREYLLGETMKDLTVWYQCTLVGGKVKRQAIGCVKDGRTLYDGEAYHQGDIVYRCLVTDKDVKGAKHDIVGCVQKDQNGIENGKTFGCQWRDGEAPSRFTYECQFKQATAVKTRMNCYYEIANAEHLLEAGCFRMINNRGVGCKNSTNGDVEYVYFEPTRLDVAHQNGLRIC